MVKIRLRRVGARKQPSYRIVVTDSRSPRDGRFIEAIGFYNPRTEPETVDYQEDRMLYWLSVGAQPSEAVARMVKSRGTMDRLARLHAGESMEDLLAEAEAAAEAEEPVASPESESGVEAEQAEEEEEVAGEAEMESPAEVPDQGEEEEEVEVEDKEDDEDEEDEEDKEEEA
jgi:small subunit ribosomal protein S16